MPNGSFAKDDDGMDKAPWYVRAFIRVGVPTAFSAILLWYFLSNVTGRLESVIIGQQRDRETSAIIVQNQARIIELLASNAQNVQANARLLTALCINSARSPE